METDAREERENKMRYLMFLLGLIFANVASAMDCEKVPDCEELGYTKDNDPNCADDGYMYCPFDHDYKICVQYNCAKLGFTESDKTSWCNKLIKCKGNPRMTLCQNLCEIGDVYYADGSCGKVENYEASTSPKPVGVVYWLKDNGAHGKVISLKNLTSDNNTYQFDPQNPYNNSYQFLFYGLGNVEDRGHVEGLQRYTLEMFKADALNRSSELFTGAKNTDILVVTKTKNERCLSGQYQEGTKDYHQYCIPNAALATRAFYPPEVSADNKFVGQGKWYLPAIGELMDLYGYDFNQITGLTGTDGVLGNIKEIVNKTLESLKAKGVDAEKFTEQYHYWASNQTETWFFKLSMVNGSRDEGALNNYARASLEF